MRLNDISKDMKNYLENRCYCPGEIYDLTGFFFKIYNENNECKLLCEGKRNSIHGKFVIVDDQIIYFEITDEKIDSAVRIDNTENNREQIVKYMLGKIDKMTFDEFSETNSKENLEFLLNAADVILTN